MEIGVPKIPTTEMLICWCRSPPGKGKDGKGKGKGKGKGQDKGPKGGKDFGKVRPETLTRAALGREGGVQSQPKGFNLDAVSNSMLSENVVYPKHQFFYGES